MRSWDEGHLNLTHEQKDQMEKPNWNNHWTAKGILGSHQRGCGCVVLRLPGSSLSWAFEQHSAGSPGPGWASKSSSGRAIGGGHPTAVEFPRRGPKGPDVSTGVTWETLLRAHSKVGAPDQTTQQQQHVGETWQGGKDEAPEEELTSLGFKIKL